MQSGARYEAIIDFQFREDLRFWIENDRRIALRVMDLMDAVIRDPFAGIGKPEPLKYVFAGCWSRRITQEHRFIYRVTASRVNFLQARYHY